MRLSFTLCHRRLTPKVMFWRTKRLHFITTPIIYFLTIASIKQRGETYQWSLYFKNFTCSQLFSADITELFQLKYTNYLLQIENGVLYALINLLIENINCFCFKPDTWLRKRIQIVPSAYCSSWEVLISDSPFFRGSVFFEISSKRKLNRIVAYQSFYGTNRKRLDTVMIENSDDAFSYQPEKFSLSGLNKFSVSSEFRERQTDVLLPDTKLMSPLSAPKAVAIPKAYFFAILYCSLKF